MRSDSNGSDDVNNGFFINKLKVEEKNMKDIKKYILIQTIFIPIIIKINLFKNYMDMIYINKVNLRFTIHNML